MSRDPRRWRWLLWGLLAISFVFVSLHRLSTAVVAEDLMAAFQTTGAQLGTLHATFFYVYAIMQLPSGILADRVGPRRTVAVGAAVMNVGAIGFAFADSYAVAFAARALIGLGGSVIFVSILRFSANWYRADEFSTMNGLAFATGGAGGILATAPLAVAVAAFGWRPTIAGLGAVGLALAGVVYLVVRDSPERAGMKPIEGVPERSTLTNAEVRANVGRVLRDRWTWVVGLLLFCTSGVNLTLLGLWGIPYVSQTYDVTVTFASTLTLLGTIGIVVGSPLIGWLADRLRRHTELIVLSTLGYTVALGTIAAVGRPPIAVVAIVFFAAGTLFGGVVLSYPIIKDRHPDNASGISTSSVNSAGFFGAALLPTLMGAALDTYWTGEFVGGARLYTETGYRVAFALAAAFAFVAFLCAIWIHHNRRTMAA